jgi:hypothetical protein
MTNPTPAAVCAHRATLGIKKVQAAAILGIAADSYRHYESGLIVMRPPMWALYQCYTPAMARAMYAAIKWID